MKKLTIILTFLLIGFTALSQELIADETTLEQGKTSVKIVSSNYFIPDSILVKFDPVIVRYSVYYKKDRAGRYKEYSITLPIERKEEVILFVQSLKRPKHN